MINQAGFLECWERGETVDDVLAGCLTGARGG